MKQKPVNRRLLMTSVLLALLALVSAAAATLAWMTIADRTRVRSMRVEITTGINLRFDLDAHDSFDEYVKSLSFEQIGQRIAKEQGFDPFQTPLEPVTTGDCVRFVLEDGTPAPTGAYLDFTLHFMATEDMVVHLTGADSEEGGDGTRIRSDIPSLPDALRISFTAEETCVYDPGMGDDFRGMPFGRSFGLPEEEGETCSPGSALFRLKKEEDKPVTVRIWLEGTDEACTDELRSADYSIQLRFVGADEQGNLLQTSRSAP